MLPRNLLDLCDSAGSANSTPLSSTVPRPPFRWWSRLVIPLGLILAIAALVLGSTWQLLLPVPAVRVEPAIGKSLGTVRPATAVVQAAGWIEPAPWPRHVSALGDGVLSELLVLEGDSVSVGQPVARLDDAAARLAVATVQATLAHSLATEAVAAARLAAAEQAWLHPVHLQREVAMAEAQAQVDLARLAETEARLAEATALLDQARRDAARSSLLADAQIASAAAAEQARAHVAASEADVAAWRQRLAATREEARRNDAALAAARSQLELRLDDQRELAAARADHARSQAHSSLVRARLAEADLHLARMTVTSPAAGIVYSRHKAPGDKLTTGGDAPDSARLLSLYDPASLQARVDVPLADAASIAPDQECELICEALPRQRFAARVTRIMHEADIQKNTLQVKVLIDNPTPGLRPEMLCRVRFLAPAAPPEPGATEDLVFIPLTAVVGERVWLMRHFDGRFGVAEPLAAPPPEAPRIDGWVAVEGLHIGDLAIVNPPGELTPGRRVRLAGEVAP